jgi:hypothetical protein
MKTISTVPSTRGDLDVFIDVKEALPERDCPQQATREDKNPVISRRLVGCESTAL